MWIRWIRIRIRICNTTEKQRNFDLFRFSSLGGPKSGGPALPGGQAGGPPGRPALCGRHPSGQGQEQEEEKKGEGIAACRYVVVMKEKKNFINLLFVSE
jgi:hypothetical protein